MDLVLQILEASGLGFGSCRARTGLGWKLLEFLTVYEFVQALPKSYITTGTSIYIKTVYVALL